MMKHKNEILSMDLYILGLKGEIDDLKVEIEELKIALKKYDAAAKKFIDKVDSGRARSIETYADLKACLERRD